MLAVSTLLDRRHGAVCIDMAAAGAVAKFADGIVPIWIYVLPVFTGVIVVCMTSGAIGFIGAGSPGNCLVVALVARSASQVTPMVSRIGR